MKQSIFLPLGTTVLAGAVLLGASAMLKNTAQNRAQEGDVVILSPASTAFDRFTNFMERGKVFKEIVNSLT